MEEMEYEGDQSEQTKGDTLSRLLEGASLAVKGANLAAGTFALLRTLGRHLDTHTMMHWLGMYRRRSVLGSAVLFGAGALAGAGIAVLASPASGQQTRQGIARGFRTIGRKGREILRAAVAEGAERPDEGKEKAGGERQDAGQTAEAGRQGAAASESVAGSTSGNGNRREAGKGIHR